jgi:hypothetical protein
MNVVVHSRNWVLVSVLSAGVALGCGAEHDDATKQSTWTRWSGNGHYYTIVRDKTDWESANAAAQAAGTHLVTITSAPEEDWIVSTFLTGADLLAVFWIGLTDRGSENSFVWVTNEPLVYTHWKSGEPNGWDGATEDYGCINWNAVRGPIGEWNDALNPGTKGYDAGANDGPYAAILESDQPR